MTPKVENTSIHEIPQNSGSSQENSASMLCVERTIISGLFQRYKSTQKSCEYSDHSLKYERSKLSFNCANKFQRKNIKVPRRNDTKYFYCAHHQGPKIVICRLLH